MRNQTIAIIIIIIMNRQKDREKVGGTFHQKAVATYSWDLLLDQFGSCKSGPYVSDLDFAALANLAALYKDYKSLHSGNAVALSADFRDLHVVFLTCFYWLWATVAEAIASSATITSFAV